MKLTFLLKCLWPLVLLALVVLSPARKRLLPWFREQYESQLADLQRKPETAHRKPETLKAARDQIKAIDPNGVSQVKLVGPLAGLMQETQQGQDSDPVLPYEPNALDHVVAVPPSGTTNILHSTFPVSTYSSFEIQVPPGMLQVSLTGNADCFILTNGHSHRLSDIVVSLMNEAEFQDLVQKNPTSATYSTDPAPTQSIQWVLDSDFKQTKKYYLIFTNPAENSSKRMVKANFSVHVY